MIQINTGNEFVDDFIAHVDSQLKKSKNTLVFHLGNDLEIDGSNVDGYYCEDEKQLAIAYDSGLSFVGVLAHEFNHFIQAKTKTVKWLNLNYNGNNCYELWWDWLNNVIELSDDDLEQVVRRVQDVEWECENMTIPMLEKFNLPVDKERYIGSANSYILFFQYAKTTRRWYEQGDGPDNENIIRYLPKEKMVDEYYHLPFGLELLF